MRTREQNFFAMAKASIAMLENHSSVWQSNKRVKKAVTDAKAIIAEIDSRNQGGLAQSGGATSQKDDVVENLANLATKITKRVKVFATDQNDLNLKQKVSFVKTDYEHMSDADLYAQIQNLITAVSPVIDDLEDYGVTQDMLDDLSAMATQFKSLETTPRTIISERKTQNAAIPDLLKMLRADLQAIDGLIGIFEDHDLENEYKNSRIVVDRGIMHRQETPPKNP